MAKDGKDIERAVEKVNVVMRNLDLEKLGLDREFHSAVWKAWKVILKEVKSPLERTWI